MHTIHAFLARLNRARRDHPALFWLRVATVAALFLFFTAERSIWTPDTLFFILLVLFVVFGQARAFLLRFAPFVLLLLTYDSFRSIADDLNTHINFWPMISFDQNLFGGTLPTETLQHWLWHGTLQWYDFYFYFLYTIHFLAPLALAVLIWKVRPRLYWQYVAALVGLSFMAFITYVVFPAAPPWMASDLGYIKPIHRISSDIWHAMGITDFSELYSQLSPNEVAAVPSLHSAYPLLFTMFVWKLFGLRRTWWLFVYPLSMWVGVVYLGEHYVMDVALGALYAVIAYFAAAWFVRALRVYQPTFARDYAHGRAKAYTAISQRKNRYKNS